jgi:hypothetical protein
VDKHIVVSDSIILSNTITAPALSSSQTAIYTDSANDNTLTAKYGSNTPVVLGINIRNLTILTQNWTLDSGNYSYTWAHGGTFNPWYNFRIQAYEAILGSELITNPTFESSTGWTEGTGWNIASGYATASTATGNLTSSITIEAGTYLVTYDIFNFIVGNLTVSIGVVSSGNARSSNNTFQEVITTTTTGDLTFNSSGFSGIVDNVYVKEITGYRAIHISDFEVLSPGTVKIWSPTPDPIFIVLL